MSKQHDFLIFAEHCRRMTGDRRCSLYSQVLADMERTWRRLASNDVQVGDRFSANDQLLSGAWASCFAGRAGTGRFVKEHPARMVLGLSEIKSDLPVPSMFETMDGRPVIAANSPAPVVACTNVHRRMSSASSLQAPCLTHTSEA
jgi:hypothetical protein